MKIGLFHGYELAGSGSNEYNRYLARTLVELGHQVHILCRDPNPQNYAFIDQAWFWQKDGQVKKEIYHDNDRCLFHHVPLGAVHPVYLQDKQRTVQVKGFVRLTDEELAEFKAVNEQALLHILQACPMDVLMANHLVMQPSVAIKACEQSAVPLVIFPHGSAIEYVVKKDPRYWREAEQALRFCQRLITGNKEVRDRIVNLFPELKESILAKQDIVGVGVDTKLFKPIKKTARSNSIKEFLHEKFTKVGKSAEESQQLKQDLQAGDWHRLHQHPKPYEEGLDQDIETKLETLDIQQPLILFVGALTVGKGLQSLICAMALVLEKLPQAQLVIIGSGAYRETLEALLFALESQNGRLLQQLCQQGFDLDRNDESGAWPDVDYLLKQSHLQQGLMDQGPQLAKKVFFLGRMNHQQLSYIFPCADLAVFPSVIPEAYPLVLMESLANGVLPMVSYFSGFRDGIDELYQYLPAALVDLLKIPMQAEHRIESMAQQIQQVLQQLAQQDNSRQLADIACQHYDWHHRAQALVESFQTLKQD